jgi:hypothetical protein
MTLTFAEVQGRCPVAQEISDSRPCRLHTLDGRRAVEDEFLILVCRAHLPLQAIDRVFVFLCGCVEEGEDVLNLISGPAIDRLYLGIVCGDALNI